MRWFWAFPLTFVAGVHGFAIFAPYLVLIAMLAASKRSRRNSRPQLSPAAPIMYLPNPVAAAMA